ncbi:MAG: glycosyltransferase family 2 protein [Planctomycetota bacterium]
MSPGSSSQREVPLHSVREYEPKRHSHCVAVFVLNEGQRFLEQLEGMLSLSGEIDILVADGGSTDGCVNDLLLQSRGVRTLLIKTGSGRLGAQMRMAFAYALDQGYEGVVTMDGNNKDDPGAIPAFVAALKRGSDHVQGSRFIADGRAVRTPLLRYLAVRLIHAPLISLAAGSRQTDTTNGFRAYSRRLLLDPRVAPFRDVFSGYELHYYLAIRAARLGYNLEEIPVIRSYPGKGSTPTKISPIRGKLLILKNLLDACCHRFDPPKRHG